MVRNLCRIQGYYDVRVMIQNDTGCRIIRTISAVWLLQRFNLTVYWAERLFPTDVFLLIV